MECKLGLCFQNAGLIGINFMFPATLQDGIGLYENIYDNIANEYGKVTDDTRTSVMYTAFWDNNPNGEGTSIYLFKNEDSTVQLSYFASEEYSEKCKLHYQVLILQRFLLAIIHFSQMNILIWKKRNFWILCF